MSSSIQFYSSSESSDKYVCLHCIGRGKHLGNAMIMQNFPCIVISSASIAKLILDDVSDKDR